ncbi:MAG TPA: hypothetical protein VLG09_00670 [Candidatus Saccharimonadales bacterium]|nr:hypothetical protein [Candidatus Saccharimonadales bacterium]
MEHQLDAVEALRDGNILWGGVGSGKTLTALSYYVKNHSEKDLYVITTAKKRDSLDWSRDAARLGIGSRADDSVHGKLTVDSWNNIGRFVESDVHGAFFIFDEQRVVGSGVWVKSFIKLARRNDWILLSATPGDTWMDYLPVFVANGFYKNATEFKREHVVYAPYSKFPKIVRYLGVNTLERLRNEILVEMPYEKHTTRYVNWLETGYDKALMKQVIKTRWNPYTDAPMVDIAELFRVMRRICNTDPSKIDTILELLRTHPRLIIFYNFNYELDILRGLKEVITVAEWNGHRKEPLPNTEKWVYLVQYVSGAEGWNCTETDAMVMYSLTYSYKNFMQAQGRIDRLDTKYSGLYYYVLCSSAPIDRSIRKSLGLKKNFNENLVRKELQNWPKSL